MQHLLFSVFVLAAMTMFAWFALRNTSRLEFRYGWLSFLAHVVSAFAMVAITERVLGGGDMLAYGRFGATMARRLADDFMGVGPMVVGLVLHSEEPIPFAGALPGSSTGAIQGISALLMLALGESLYAVCLLIAGLGFLSKLAIYRVLRQELSHVSQQWLLVGCLLVPSAVFWSCGLLKEPLAMIGLGMMVHGGHRWVRAQRRPASFVWFLSGGVLVALVKGYILPPFGIAAGIWYFLSSSSVRAKGNVIRQTRFLIVGALLAGGVVVATGALLPRYATENFAEQAVRMQELGAATEGGSNYELGGEAELSVAVLGIGVLTALFRPFIFEAHNAMSLATALEMLLFTLVFLGVLIRKRVVRSIAALFDAPALAFCAIFVVALAVGVGLTTTNMGTLARYRAPFISFFAVLLIGLGAVQRPAEQAARDRSRLPLTTRSAA